MDSSYSIQNEEGLIAYSYCIIMQAMGQQKGIR